MKIILSISGGGIRGLIPAIVLAELEKEIGKGIGANCNLIAGNSTGGIITCLLAAADEKGEAKYTAEEIVAFYKTFGKTVFKKSLLRKIFTLDGLIFTKYSYKPLEKLMKQYLGDLKLEDTITDILIPTYQVSDIPLPYFFKSIHAKKDGNITFEKQYLQNVYLWQCARATSAANSYFAPYQYGDLTFVDGGIFANNPSVCAYAEGKNMWGEEEPIALISLGTGENLKGYPYKKIKNWGILQWAIPFFKQSSLSSDEAINYILETFSHAKTGDQYYCLQAKLDEDCTKMDNASEENLIRLEQAAKQMIQDNKQTFDSIVSLFTTDIDKNI